MKLIYCGLLLLCPYMSRAVDALTIGDQVPMVLLQNIKTSDGNSLAAIKGKKWLILDFMSSSCVSCIKLLPGFTSLQQQFAADLEIVLVTVQPVHKMQAFLQKHPALDFSMVGEDTLLEKYFPHQTISHLVWINPAGIVKAITSGYYLNENTFALAKTNAPLYWPVKQDGKPYDYRQALLTYNPFNLQESFSELPVYYTAARAALPDVQPFTLIAADTPGHVKRYSFINQSLTQIVAKMFGRATMPASFFIIKSRQEGRFLFGCTLSRFPGVARAGEVAPGDCVLSSSSVDCVSRWRHWRGAGGPYSGQYEPVSCAVGAAHDGARVW